MNSFERFSESVLKYNSVDRALEDYLELLRRENAADEKVIHKNAAIKRIAATVPYSILVFLIISFFMCFHEYSLFFCISGIAAFTAAWGYIITTSFTTVKSLRHKIQKKPDADIDSFLADEKANFWKLDAVRGICGSIIAVTLLLTVVAYWSPHMVFRKNSNGYCLQYYTLSLHPASEVEIPDYWKEGPVTEIRGSAFYGMKSLRLVKLPRGITEIHRKTFEKCRNLESMDIPEGVVEIEDRAFSDCRNLSSVSIPSTMETIGSYAFRRCYKLSEIVLPYGCKKDENAFKESDTKIYYSDGITITEDENTQESDDYDYFGDQDDTENYEFEEYEYHAETGETDSSGEIYYVKDKNNKKALKVGKPAWCNDTSEFDNSIWFDGKDGWMTIRYATGYANIAIDMLISDREYYLDDPDLLNVEEVSGIKKTRIGDMEVFWFKIKYRYESDEDEGWTNYTAVIINNKDYIDIEDLRIGDYGYIEFSADDFLNDVAHVSLMEE